MLYTKKIFDYEYPLKEADVCLVGIPFSSTEIGQPVKYGPLFIREAIRNLMGHNPKTGKNIFKKYKFCNIGDIEIVPGSWEKTDKVITDTMKGIFSENKKVFPVFLGGEHLISLSIIRNLQKIRKGLTVVDFDAHRDLLPDWLGEEHSHITWAYRLLKGSKYINMVQIGCRIFEEEEQKNFIKFGVSDKIGKINNPVYLTIDLDVLDPSVCPEVGTQQASGMSFEELKKELMKLKGSNIVGMDIVECASREAETRTAHIAAELIRTVLEIRKV